MSTMRIYKVEQRLLFIKQYWNSCHIKRVLHCNKDKGTINFYQEGASGCLFMMRAKFYRVVKEGGQFFSRKWARVYHA